MSKNIKHQLESILEASEQADRQFLGSLSEEERNAVGSYEDWSAKDLFAHVNFWQRYEADKALEWLETGRATPGPQFEQSNLEAYETFKDKTWEELLEYSEATMEKMRAVLQNMSEQALLGASWESEDRKMWTSIVQRLYSHKLFHYAEFYEGNDQQEVNSHLWSEWAELVSPLDQSDSWQGRVSYNAACGLALAGDRERALDKLTRSLELNPGMKSWARLDQDLSSLHGEPEFKDLIAEEYWWTALEANPQAEAIADQFMRTFTTLRRAVASFPDSAWLEGETNYQRPAGLGLHIAQSIAMFSALKSGDLVDHACMQINWESSDSTRFPGKAEFLAFLDAVEEKLAVFLATADLNAREDQFPWTGRSKLGRAIYALRHAQHHLADMTMELQRRGLTPPDWA